MCRVAWDVAVIGAGYVGLPLAVRFAATGTRVVCIDPDPAKVATIMAGESYVGYVQRRIGVAERWRTSPWSWTGCSGIPPRRHRTECRWARRRAHNAAPEPRR